MSLRLEFFSEKQTKEFVEEKIVPRRIPITGMFELTYHCNLRCRHCYIPRKDYRRELSCSEILEILDQIANEGCLWLLFSGGEPLVREDFLKIYTYAKKKGFLITIFTNATLIGKRIKEVFEKLPPYEVSISLYGTSPQTYEKITQVAGSFKQAMQAIEWLISKKINLELKIIVMKLNKHEFIKVKEFAQRHKLRFRYDPKINPGLDGSKHMLRLRLSPREAAELDLCDRDYIDAFRRVWKKFKGPVAKNNENFYFCNVGRLNFLINPYGELQLCVMAREPNYSVLQGSFKEGWQKEFPKTYLKKNKKDYPCRHCELINLCGQCPAWATLETGSSTQPVKYLCELAHWRKKLLGLK